MDELFDDTHSQFSTMNISIGQNWLNKKKTIWVYSSSPHKWDRNNKCKRYMFSLSQLKNASKIVIFQFSWWCVKVVYKPPWSILW